MDLEITSELRHKVLVERKGLAFFMDLESDNLPVYCSYCKCVGHHSDMTTAREDPLWRRDKWAKKDSLKSKTGLEPRQVYVQVEKYIRDGYKGKTPMGETPPIVGEQQLNPSNQ